MCERKSARASPLGFAIRQQHQRDDHRRQVLDGDQHPGPVDGQHATNVVVVDDQTITCDIPAGEPGVPTENAAMTPS